MPLVGNTTSPVPGNMFVVKRFEVGQDVSHWQSIERFRFFAGPMKNEWVARTGRETEHVNFLRAHAWRPPHECHAPKCDEALLDLRVQHKVQQALFTAVEPAFTFSSCRDRDGKFSLAILVDTPFRQDNGSRKREWLKVLAPQNAGGRDELPGIEYPTGKAIAGIPALDHLRIEVIPLDGVEGMTLLHDNEVLGRSLQRLQYGTREDDVAVEHENATPFREEERFKFGDPPAVNFARGVEDAHVETALQRCRVVLSAIWSLIKQISIVGYHRRMLATQHCVKRRSPRQPAM